jgi:hypothetical protein
MSLFERCMFYAVLAAWNFIAGAVFIWAAVCARVADRAPNDLMFVWFAFVTFVLAGLAGAIIGTSLNVVSRHGASA